MLEGTRGPTPGGGATRGGPVPLGGVATSWPSSVSALDFVSCRGKYELWASFCPISKIFPM
jgi:hypothetical protein